ncbi:hypothetical protein GCM10009839_15570 [Catenulispora yoronensis]|uniref:Uncharacterized protein n=1 Tax=Catenulispora yoronensis TaxID=450799 RepID=A0ABP5FB94_9ACTN
MSLNQTPAATTSPTPADLRELARRDYLRLFHHAARCPDCTPGNLKANPPIPPRIRTICATGMEQRREYEAAYRAWETASRAEEKGQST